MNRLLVFLSLCVLAGCDSAPPAPAVNSPAKIPSEPEAAKEKAWTVEGADFHMFYSDPTYGQWRKPAFSVHAETGSVVGTTLWAFERAHAVIYGKEEDGSDIQLDAGKGQVVESKTASMSDGVTARTKDMVIQLQDLEWRNEERYAWSDHPLTLTSPDLNAQAASMRLYPDRKEIVMTDVKATKKLEGSQP